MLDILKFHLPWAVRRHKNRLANMSDWYFLIICSHQNSTTFMFTNVNDLFLMTSHVIGTSWINDQMMFIIDQFLTYNCKCKILFFVRVSSAKILLFTSFFNCIRGLEIPNLFFIFIILSRSSDITFNFLVPVVSRIMSFLSTIVALLHLPVVKPFACLFCRSVLWCWISLSPPGRELLCTYLFL